MQKIWLAIAGMAMVTGCANNQGLTETHWTIQGCSKSPVSQVSFKSPPSSSATHIFPKISCDAVEKAAARIEEAANLKIDEIFFTDQPGINAYATKGQNEKSLVGITLGMLDAVGSDEDAWAALLGHEIAHHSLNHGESRSTSIYIAQGLGRALGQAVALLVPGVGGLVGGNVTSYVTTQSVYGAYSRTQEREADETSLRWMVAAGYDPRGMERLITILGKTAGSGQPQFLSTHPGIEDRAQMVRDFIQQQAL